MQVASSAGGPPRGKARPLGVAPIKVLSPNSFINVRFLYERGHFYLMVGS